MRKHRSARVLSTAVLFALVLLSLLTSLPQYAGAANDGGGCTAADGTSTVSLINGDVVTIDAVTVSQLQVAVTSGSTAAIAAVISGSGFPTAALLITGHCLNSSATQLLAAGATQANPADLQEALEMFSYADGVEGSDIVAGVRAAGNSLARA